MEMKRIKYDVSIGGYPEAENSVREGKYLKADITDEKYSESSIRKVYEKITKRLIEKGLTLTAMESCTSGQIISLITDTEGASAVVKGSYVTYSNEAKVMHGVPAETIETYGVYSRETAEAMAAACKKSFGSDIGIGVTGTLGNVDVNNKDSVPGHVCFAIAIDTEKVCDKIIEETNSTCKAIIDEESVKEEIFVYEQELKNWPARYQYKLEIARMIGEELSRLL